MGKQSFKYLPPSHFRYDVETFDIFLGATRRGNLYDEGQTVIGYNEITGDDVTVSDMRAMAGLPDQKPRLADNQDNQSADPDFAELLVSVRLKAAHDEINRLKNRIVEIEKTAKTREMEHESRKMEHETREMEHESRKMEHEAKRTGSKNSKFKGNVLVENIRYASLVDAAEKSGIAKSTISRRIKAGADGYCFIPKDTP
jgi:hypothetical protein